MIAYILCVAFGMGIGFFICAWTRKLPEPLLVSHDHCDERFNLMRARLTKEIRAREDEIHALVRGQS